MNISQTTPILSCYNASFVFLYSVLGLLLSALKLLEVFGLAVKSRQEGRSSVSSPPLGSDCFVSTCGT